MKRNDLLLVLALLVLGARGSRSKKSWAPMGPFEEDNTLPSQPKIPANPLGRP